MSAAERGASIGAVVLTGADRFLCVGGNLRRLLENRAQTSSVQAANIDLPGEWIIAIRAAPQPAIAAIEGAAAGAGTSHALACDLIVVADDATFVMSYARVALTPDGGSSWRLARALPRAPTTEILIQGKSMRAKGLHDLGVVNRLARAGSVFGDALAWADELGRVAPNLVTRVKALLAQAPDHSLGAHLTVERDHGVASLHHADGLEGIIAFLGKRPPSYTR